MKVWHLRLRRIRLRVLAKAFLAFAQVLIYGAGALAWSFAVVDRSLIAPVFNTANRTVSVFLAVARWANERAGNVVARHGDVIAALEGRTTLTKTEELRPSRED